jgi:SAM-dependent methyltransferase
MVIQKRLRRNIKNILAKIGLKTLALQIYNRTWLGNMFAFELTRNQKFAVPPAALMHHATGITDKHRFIWSGRLTMARMIDMLQNVGIELNRISSILDFGCGCGRLTRYLLLLFENAKVYGTDTDALSISWCEANLKPGNFSTSRAQPPLQFANESFDLIVSYSVFTHIHESDQAAWMSEMSRILKPEGLLVFSTQGYGDIFHITSSDLLAEQLQRYQKGNVVSVHAELGYVQDADYGTFHPEGFVERMAKASRLELVNTFLSQPAPPMDSAGHNLHLLKKVKR